MKPSTVAAYEHHAKPLRVAYGTKALQKITKADLERVVGGLLASSAQRPTGVTARTANHAIALYRQVFKDATEEGLLVRSPAALIRKVRDERDTGDRTRPFDTWSREQVAAFMGQVADDRLLGVWTAVGARAPAGGRRAGCGGRRTWTSTPRPSPSAARRTLVNGQVIEGTPKSRLSRRTISLGPGAVARLRTARKTAVAERLAAGAIWGGGTYVASRRGRSPGQAGRGASGRSRSTPRPRACRAFGSTTCGTPA